MDKHDPVHYGLHALAAIGIVGAFLGLSGKPSSDTVSSVYHADLAALSAVPFGKTEYHVLAAPSSGPLPYVIAEAIRAKGGIAVEESAFEQHEGVWVSPDTAASHAIADELSKIIGDPVRVVDERGRFEIGVGFPFHKAAH